MEKRTVRTLLTVVLFSCLLFGNALYGAEDPFAKMGVIRPKKRLIAPDFTLKGLDGIKKSLIDFRGKVILLNFWATWCPPCRQEMPDMEKLYRNFKDRGFVIIAVAANALSAKRVKSFVKKLGLTFPVFLDPDGHVRNNYEVMAMPMSYIIGKDGKISGRIIGGRKWSSVEANLLIKHLIKERM